MKKTLLTALSVWSLFALSAQDLKQVKKQIDKKDWAGARTTIDQVVANDKYSKDQDAWYTKGKIYSQFATDSSLKGTVPDANMIALRAFETAYALDSTKTQIEATLDSKFAYIANLYSTTFNEAYKIFQKNDFANALHGFQNTDSVGRFLYERRIGLTALDTVVTYYLGFAEMKLEKNDSTTFYFRKLADAKVTGQGFDLPYRWMVYYYSDKKDWDNAQKYAALGKGFYPKESYFDDVALQMLKDQGKTDELIKKYEDVIAADPNNYEHQYNYGNTLFSLVYGVEKSKEPANSPELITKLEAAFTKCTEIDANRPEAYLALGKSHFNQAVTINDSLKLIKGKTPADDANKKALQTTAEGQIKSAIAPLEKVFGFYDGKSDLKAADKSNYKTSISLLGDCYRYIDNKEKAKFYDDKYTAADAIK
jgi:hypothetical protein